MRKMLDHFVVKGGGSVSNRTVLYTSMYRKKRKLCGINVVNFKAKHPPYSRCANFNCATDTLL